MNYRVGIIGGRGVMGSFFQKIFQKYECNVSVWGRNSEISLEKFLEKLDIVVISVPIDATEKMIEKVGEYLTEDQCITDLTSLKEFPMTAMREKTKAKYFGMHPMFAPPLSGTMLGQNILFCEGTATAEQEFCEQIFSQDGAICLSTTPEEHDTLMTMIQGLSHFLDISFIKTLSKTNVSLENVFASRSPAYALKMMMAGRTLYQDANLYGNIQIQNPRNIKTLELFFESAQEIFSLIKEKNLQGFTDVFETEKKYLGEYAERSQKESDKVIDFLARKILKKPENSSSQDEIYGKTELLENTQNSVGILGPKNTFSYIAAEKFFGSASNCVLSPSIPALFSAYAKGKISQIFVPLENMLHGSVAETVDGILHSNLKIQKIFEMKISPSLFVPVGLQKEDITQIFSHPQALAQCSDFLEQNFPDVEFVPMPSTAGGVEKILDTPFSAAIAASETAEKYPVESLFTHIANTSKNATRFALLAPKSLSLNENQNPGISPHAVFEGGMMFTFAKDAPGTLESVLHLFSQNKINLTKIESRPTGEGFGEYSFFVTYSGTLCPIEKEYIFAEISEKVSLFRFLGEFEIVTD